MVNTLIAYGQNLITTFQQRPSGPLFVRRAAAFGTLDLALIIARITCGLRRAAFLAQRLDKRAATGRELAIGSMRRQPDDTGTPPGEVTGASPEKPPRKPRAAPRPPVLDPDGLPTVEQIAADVRRKPIGAVIADICRDLGITAGVVERALHCEIRDAIAFYRGNYQRYFRDMLKRVLDPVALRLASPEIERWVADGPTPALASTGPPTGPP